MPEPGSGSRPRGLAAAPRCAAPRAVRRFGHTTTPRACLWSPDFDRIFRPWTSRSSGGGVSGAAVGERRFHRARGPGSGRWFGSRCDFFQMVDAPGAWTPGTATPCASAAGRATAEHTSLSDGDAIRDGDGDGPGEGYGGRTAQRSSAGPGWSRGEIHAAIREGSGPGTAIAGAISNCWAVWPAQRQSPSPTAGSCPSAARSRA